MSGLSDKIYLKSPIWAQQFMTAAYGWHWYRRRHSRSFHEFVAQLHAQERWSAEQYRLYQEKQLQKILDAAWNSPYYREVFTNHGVLPNMSPFDALDKIPILTKATLRVKARDLLTVSPLPRDAQTFRSSGTTGTPTEIFHPREMLQKGQGWIEARSRYWAKLNYRSRRVMFGSRKICRFDQKSPPFWRISPIENMTYMSIYHLSPGLLSSYLAYLRDYRPELIMGYPSALFAVAKYAVTTNDFPAPAKAVITTSESVTPMVQQIIEEVWQCKVFGTYGSVEHCVFASQCEFGNFHLSPEVGIVEVVDQNGNICPPGRSGIAVCTGIHNTLQPLIRYEIGDAITFSTETDCPCGRTLPQIESIDGRLESMCYLPDGRMTLRFDTVFKGVNNIWEAQVIQERIDLFRILVVPSSDFSADDRNLIYENMKLHAGNVRVEIVPVSQIKRTPNGKFQSVICNLSNEEIYDVLSGQQK